MGSDSSKTPSSNEIPSTSSSSIASNAIQKQHQSRSRRKQHRFHPVIGKIKLADDDAPEPQSESDRSAYDSFNDAETGLFMFIIISILFLLLS